MLLLKAFCHFERSLPAGRQCNGVYKTKKRDCSILLRCIRNGSHLYTTLLYIFPGKGMKSAMTNPKLTTNHCQLFPLKYTTFVVFEFIVL